MCVSSLPHGFFNPNPLQNWKATTQLAVDATQKGQDAANKATQIGMAAQRKVWTEGMKPATPTALGGNLNLSG